MHEYSLENKALRSASGINYYINLPDELSDLYVPADADITGKTCTSLLFSEKKKITFKVASYLLSCMSSRLG